VPTEHCPDCEGKGICVTPCEKCTGGGLGYYTKEQLRCHDCDGCGNFLYVCPTCEGTGFCEKEPAVVISEKSVHHVGTGGSVDE